MARGAEASKLPDPAALETAWAAGKEDECRDLILEVLDHGTRSNSETTTTTPKSSNRIEETIRWFENGLGKVASSASTSASMSSAEMIEDVVVDCLWLMGSSLVSLPWSPPEKPSGVSSASSGKASGTESPASAAAMQALHPSVRALILIVRAMLAASYWNRKAPSDSDGGGAAAADDDDNRCSSGLRFSRKLQENWFPVLLERIDSIKVTTTATPTTTKIRLQRPVDDGTTGSADDLMKRLRQFNTAANYKQSKYNLLQEESEGYSKVLQYLCGEEVGGDNCDDGETDDAKHGPSYLWQLAGTFELDPNRILDLSLDVLEARLSTTTTTTTRAERSGNTGKRNELPVLTKEIRGLLDVIRGCSTDKLPPLLRFKLRAGGSGVVEKSNGFPPLPASSFLMETIALLIREGLMDLRTFVEDYFEPTLGPDIGTAYEIFRKKERDRVMALSRVSLSGSAGQKENPKQIELAVRLKTAVGKLKLRKTTGKDGVDAGNESGGGGGNGHVLSLLLILIRWGEWERVESLLSSTASSTYSLSGPTLSLWSKLCCLMPETFGSALLDGIEGRVHKASVRTGSIAPRLTKNKTKTSPSEEGEDPESPPISTMQELTDLVQSISHTLSHLIPSGCIRSRPVLYCNLCRLLRTILTNIKNESKGSIIHSVPQAVFSFFESFLVPSLSLFPSNPAVSTELWSVLELLPYDLRYKLYEGWKGSGLEKAGLVGGGSKPLPNVEAEMVAGKATRYSLKRLSKDNIRDMSRQLAKVTHSNPLVVFATILGQIESYDNLVEVMVEAQRFVNPLGLDVLGYCILGRLSGTSGGVNRSRLKEDGVNVSQWLQSLETFTGAFYKARPSVEFRGILSYLIERVKGGNVMELGMLRTLLKVVGGFSFADYSPAASLNETQLNGRCGSVTLKRETMSFGIVEKTNALAIDRVRSVLQTDGLGVSLLILITQARDRIIFNSAKGAFKEVKLVGNLYDTCQVVISILLEFLTDADDCNETDGSSSINSHISMYSRYLPSFQDLQRKYGLDMATTWLLCRPCVNAAQAMGSEKCSNLARFELSEDVRKSYSDALPESVWNVLTPRLFESFYMTSLSDIYCPEGVLASEINRIEKEVERIQAMKNSASRNESRELERLRAVLKQLNADRKKQKGHVESTLEALNEEKEKFFASEEISGDAARAFLTYCIYPRSTQSPDDAMYSGAIPFQLHKVWTPGFSIMNYLDELFSIVSGALFGVTEAEAANLAILLWQTLKVVNSWRHQDGVYDKEVLGKPGSSMETTEDGKTSTNPVSHEDFIELYNKWQYSLADALVGCLQSTEYIHTRTGLVVLSRLVKVFPTGPTLGSRLLKTLESLQDENSSRPDIRASASAYGMMLLKARDEGKWVEEDEADAKARAEKEKEAAEERKRKIEQAFQELKRDNEKINAEIGTDDRRDFPRVGSRDGFGNPVRRMEGSRQGAGRDVSGSGRAGRDFSRTENGRDRRGDDRDRRGDDRDRRSGRDGDWREKDRDKDDDPKDDRARKWRSSDDEDRRGSSNRDDDGRRVGGSSNRDGDDRRVGGSSNRDGGGDQQQQQQQRGERRDDGRWRRDDSGASRTAKRSRPASPIDDRDGDRSNASKRPRTDAYPSSSSRRPRSPEPPSSRPVRSARRPISRR